MGGGNMAEVFSPGVVIEGEEGRYRIEELLNQGRFANSYRAIDEVTSNEVFFKQYTDPTEMSGEIFQRFVEQQHYLFSLLQGVEVVEANYEFFEKDGFHYQAKEYMKGKNLDALLYEESPEVEQRRRIAVLVAYAISQIHGKGIVHSDLKPQQIYLEEDPSIAMGYKVKVVDFDFCQIPGKYDSVYRVSTPLYSSPEHLRDADVDFASDVFTTGIILYEVLSGRYPYAIPDDEHYAKAVFSYNILALKELNPAVSDEVSYIVHRMLSPVPSERPSMREVHQELRRWYRGEISLPSLPERIYLVGVNGFKASVHKSMIIGRDWCRVFEGYKYVSPEQFRVLRTDSNWEIEGLEAVNPTYLNGADITGRRSPLQDGDVITIGKCKLKVEFK
jgi:serine/threonine-protein kinase